jgi:hypothetical protein
VKVESSRIGGMEGKVESSRMGGMEGRLSRLEWEELRADWVS